MSSDNELKDVVTGKRKFSSLLSVDNVQLPTMGFEVDEEIFKVPFGPGAEETAIRSNLYLTREEKKGKLGKLVAKDGEHKGVSIQKVIIDQERKSKEGPPPVRVKSSWEDLMKVSAVHTDKNRIKPNFAGDLVGRHPFRAVHSGGPGSGKTTLLFHLYEYFFSLYFDVIVLVSPTFKQDDTWKSLTRQPSMVITSVDDGQISEVLEKQRATIAKVGIHNSPKYWWILDDVIQSGDIMRNEHLSGLFTLGRHLNSSITVNTQKYNGIPKMWRRCSTVFFIFRTQDHGETQSVEDEQTISTISRKQFRDLLNFATNEPYSFLTVMKGAQVKDQRKTYRRGFDQIIYPTDPDGSGGRRRKQKRRMKGRAHSSISLVKEKEQHGSSCSTEKAKGIKQEE